MSLRRLSAVVGVVCLFAGLGGGACGGSGGGDPPAPLQTTLPQVVSVGGPVLTAPKVLPILYASDPAGGDVLGFLQELTTNDYWHQTTSEYSVGPLTVFAPAPTAASINAPAPAIGEDALTESSAE